MSSIASVLLLLIFFELLLSLLWFVSIACLFQLLAGVEDFCLCRNWFAL